MHVEDTLRIAEESGLPHARFQGTPQVLTSDFLVDFDDPQRPTVAIQAKYSTDLQKPNVIERLELERRYWQEKGIPWVIVTEREVSREAFSNIQWLYPAQAEDSLDESQLAQYLEQFTQEFERHPERKLTDIAQQFDTAYQLEAGIDLPKMRSWKQRIYRELSK